MNKEYVFRKITRHYLRWTKRKLKQYTEVFHHKRLLIENLVYKYKQSFFKTSKHEKLKTKYFVYISKIFDREIDCVIFSFKVFLLYIEGNYSVYLDSMKKCKPLVIVKRL